MLQKAKLILVGNEYPILEETTDDERIDDTGESDESDDEILKDEPVETLEYDIFVPCREHFLTKDQQFYFQSFNGMKEIGRMQEMWIKPKDGYQVGTYLEAHIKFSTKYATKWRTNQKFRAKVFKKLKAKETCPE